MELWELLLWLAVISVILGFGSIVVLKFLLVGLV